MRKLDAPTLRRSALAYLGRYATSSAGLTQTLRRRVQKWRRLHGGEADGDAALIDETVAFCVANRLVDDEAFAETRVVTLRHRGYPTRRIREALAAKGLARETIAQALENDEGDDEAAATRFAERKRLGPWRRQGRAEKRERDIAAMMRAGFSLSLARAAIDADAPDQANAVS